MANRRKLKRTIAKLARIIVLHWILWRRTDKNPESLQLLLFYFKINKFKQRE